MNASAKPKKEYNRSTEAISVTIDKKLLAATTVFLLPKGMLNLPKGTFSTLFGELLSDWLQRVSEVDILDLYDYLELNPNATKEDVVEWFNQTRALTAEAAEAQND